ncbi:hypothetical protein ACLM5J_06830 [Nocardioides sp. Bht2]|uniref:hypothetical protein n=1 Tax=Nocardioides sp. Bht2 TaxID=3392297 RepID=UPI0039B4555A
METPAGVLDALDARVRDLVRRDRLDPQVQGALVRSLVETVVREHDQLSLTGRVAALADPQAMVAELMARVAGFGLLQPYLDDPSVEEVWINEPSQVFVARAGRHELTTTVLTSAQVDELVERMLKASGRRGTSRFLSKMIAIALARQPSRFLSPTDEAGTPLPGRELRAQTPCGSSDLRSTLET